MSTLPFIIQKLMGFSDCNLTERAYRPAYLSIPLDVNEAMLASFGAIWKELIFDGLGYFRL